MSLGIRLLALVNCVCVVLDVEDGVTVAALTILPNVKLAFDSVVVHYSETAVSGGLLVLWNAVSWLTLSSEWPSLGVSQTPSLI